MTDEYDYVFKDIISVFSADYKRFYPDFEFGTLLYKNGTNEFLLCCANQGAACIDGVFVKSIIVNDNLLIVNVYINEAERQVCLKLENNS